MKNGKRPTVAQKRLMAEWHLNPADWLVSKDTPEKILLVHRHSDKTTKTLPKG